jgi:microcystin-dependent protein
MRPLNLDNSPCTPTSSNCVIWSGPDLDCIKLCTGDTISDVVAKLATELCAVLDTLNVSNYDLACLNLNTCAPSDFEQLIQLLIDKVCALENAPVDPANPPSTGCPTDCIVAVADCLGGGTDTLINYVQTIANRVCSIVSEIAVINSSIDVINITLADLQTQIDDIPVYTLPNVSITCTIGAYPSGSSVRLDTLVTAFINNVWCPYVTTTGSAAQIAAAIQPDCTLTDIISEPGWVSPINTLADAINNIWVSICYFYNLAIPTTIVTGSDGITVTPTTVGSTTTYDVSLTTPLSAIMPAGAVIPWASPNAVAPVGWLFCDGAFYNSTIYPDLYVAIGTTYGTTVPGIFAVPNMASRIPVGVGPNVDGYDLTTIANTGGDRTVALILDQLPIHDHDINLSTSGNFADLNTASTNGTTGDAPTRTGDYARIKVGADNDLVLDDHAQQTTHAHSVFGTSDPTGSGDAHPNMQPYIVMQYIIKY